MAEKYEVSLDINELVESIRGEISSLDPLTDECCIYKVPQQLRELNDKAYMPRIVSIGPYHHGKQELQPMEEHKTRYLADFLLRSNMDLSKFVEGIREMEMRLRRSYAERIEQSRMEFLKMMAVDGAFLIEYLLKWYFGGSSSSDRIFNKQRLGNMLCFDLLMLENQLPFFFVEHLFKLSNASKVEDEDELSVIELVSIFLSRTVAENWFESNKIINGNIAVHHLVDFLAIQFLQPSRSSVGRKCTSMNAPTISKLHRAGAKFKSGSSQCLLDINFEKGILKIPKFKVTDYTEILVRNVQAYEQCHDHVYYANDYFSIMDILINDAEDVEILVKSGTIENWLGDNGAAATFFNNMGKHNLVYDPFYYCDLLEDLNAYCKSPWHKWKASLKQKYFNNPWTIISVVAAGFLLLLTLIQTVCSVRQVA